MTVKVIIDTLSILRDALQKRQGLKYLRLAQSLEEGIKSGAIERGVKLPPHRILADKLGITAGTVSRAYAELERVGMVVARVGDGTYVQGRGPAISHDRSFRNFIDSPTQYHDMSRNMHIPGPESDLLSRTLACLSLEPDMLQELMLYTPDAGLARHRQAGANWLSNGEFIPPPEQVLCVNGSQHGLLCVLMAMLRAGDTLVTEKMTYPGLPGLSRSLGIKIVGADMDDEGLIPASLHELCHTNKVTALYCTPSIQNPTTSVLSIERRREIARVCREHNILIIEDETHAVLMKERPLPIAFFAPERGIVISSLSKAVAAGLRVGFIYVPATLVERQAAAIRNSCWMATPLSLEIASRWIAEGTVFALVERQIAEIMRRKNRVAALLQGVNYRTHPCSPHFWLEVPAPWRAAEIEHNLRQRDHLIATAEAFYVGKGSVPQWVRASVSNHLAGDSALIEGFSLLSAYLRDSIDFRSESIGRLS